MRGEVEVARTHVRAAIDAKREAGELVEAASMAQAMAFVETRAGDIAAAERVLRTGIAELEEVGNVSYRGTSCLMLARLLARRGTIDEAAHWCSVARQTMTDDDLVDVVMINAVEGLVAAHRGDHAEAEQLTAWAIEVAATIDFYETKADGFEFRARAFALAGKQEQARKAAATALAIHEAKGDQPAARWIRELLDSLPS